MTGHFDIVKWLVMKGGANIVPVAQKPEGATPLHVAVHAGRLDSIYSMFLSNAKSCDGLLSMALTRTPCLLTDPPLCISRAWLAR